VIYLYLERFQEKVLDRTKFFGSRHKSRTDKDKASPESLPSDLATGD
jgi:hypothetical protein